MFKFLQKFFSKESTKVIWVGTLELPWISKKHDGLVTYVNLFEDTNGNRSYVVSGHISGDPTSTGWKYHKLYGKIIIPFVNGCSLDFLADKLQAYNADYWYEHGYDVSEMVSNPEVFYVKKGPKIEKEEENVITINFGKEKND